MAARELRRHQPARGPRGSAFRGGARYAGEALGARGTLEETLFRDAYAQGRVTEAQLLKALARRYPDVLNLPPVRLGEQHQPPEQILLKDLLYGAPAPAPVRAVQTRVERSARQVAGRIDEQCVKWCAAFCDGGQASWKMPGRTRGLYAAWADLAPRDRTLTRRGRRVLAQLLKQHAEDTVLEALERLAVPEPRWQSYIQAHLTCLPGWASHIRWRSEHIGDADLVAYLAMRLAYEVVLLGGSPAQPGGRGGPESTQELSSLQRAMLLAEACGVRDAATTDLSGAQACWPICP